MTLHLHKFCLTTLYVLVFQPIEWQAKTEECDRRSAITIQTAKALYDSNTRSLQQLQIGSHARVQDLVNKRWNRITVVMGHGRICGYLLQTPSERVL